MTPAYGQPRLTGANSTQFGEYLMKAVEDPNVESRWDQFVKGQ